MWNWLSGKKTYLTAMAAGLATAGTYMGWIPEDTYEKLLGILGPAGLAFLRMGVKKD